MNQWQLTTFLLFSLNLPAHNALQLHIQSVELFLTKHMEITWQSNKKPATQKIKLTNSSFKKLYPKLSRALESITITAASKSDAKQKLIQLPDKRNSVMRTHAYQ